MFEDDDSSLLPHSGGFLGRRAHHLVDMLAQPDDCIVRHILQIWDSDLERIKRLDQRQILVDVNAALLQGSVVVKGISLSELHFSFFLGFLHHDLFCAMMYTSSSNMCIIGEKTRSGLNDSLEYLLSDVRRDANGSVVYVGATMMTWLLDNNPQVRFNISIFLPNWKVFGSNATIFIE